MGTHPIFESDFDCLTAKMRSRASTSSSNSIMSSSTNGITNEELGISQSEGALGLTRSEELELGIDTVKQRIISCSNEEQRAILIEKLIELRTELQDLKSEPSQRAIRRLGHEFRPVTVKSESYCEQCTGSVWSRADAVQCVNCQLFVHRKCVTPLSRRCQGAGPGYVMSICPERGLHEQKYRCRDCRCRIALEPTHSVAGAVVARLCNYTGYFFCHVCHWNDLKSLPALIILNWDFEPRPVSRSAYRQLTAAFSKSLINIEDNNSQLFSFVEELQQIRKLRGDIIRMKVYLSCCPLATDSRLLLRLAKQQHFVDSHSEYTLNDLFEINTGKLIDYLTEVHADFARHIKLDCDKCQAKGFICELCTSDTVIFPFDTLAISCSQCGAVYHKECFVESECPRCSRIKQKESY